MSKQLLALDHILNRNATHPVKAHSCHHPEPLMSMTEQDMMDRILWFVDGYRYGYTTLDEVMAQIMDIVNANRETLR